MSHAPLRRAAALAVAAASLLVVLPSSASAKAQDLKVMVRNVYVGADLIPLAAARTPEEFERAAAERFQTLQVNDFATRAKALAREIRGQNPDLVALQEAAVWRRGPDGIKDGSQTPANDIIYDSTQLLLQELQAAGRRYRVAVSRDWFDFEGPTALGYDVRVTQRDVILVRVGSRVNIRRTFRGGFNFTFDPPTAVGTARQLRGWVGVDATLARRRFRLVNTHLEAYSPEHNERQMEQLLAGVAASKRRPTLLVGDINSGPDATGTDDRQAERTPSGYRAALDGGFRNPLPKTNSCCFAEDLRSTAEPLDSWIDHILVRPRMRVLRSTYVGESMADRLGGLWPSDHSGIAATIRLR